MALPKGLELMLNSVIKMLGLDPVFMAHAVEDIRKSLHSAATDMERIRRQNSAIMSHFGIADILPGDLNNGQLSDQREQFDRQRTEN